MVSQFDIGLLVGLAAVQTLVAYRAYRRRADGDAGLVDDTAELVDGEDGLVHCPECGAQNELGYRYCRACVSELPGRRAFQRDAGSPRSRMVR